MSDKDKSEGSLMGEEKELATSRLLDILRAKEPGEVSKSKDIPVKDEKKQDEKSIPSSVFEKNLIQTKDDVDIKEKNLEEVPSDVLQHAELLRKEKPGEKEEKEVEPVEFDGSLFSVLPGGVYKSKSKGGLSRISHLFNDSRQKITIYCSGNHLRLLRIKSNSRKIKVERYAEYTLPYQVEDKVIEDMDGLIAYVLASEHNLSKRKIKYGALYSSKILTKTNIMQIPKLKAGELSDMVNWSSKKNLPFNQEQAIIDWEVTSVAGNPSQNNIIVGVSDRESIEKNLGIFRDNNINLRLSSTLPILLWKLFVHNYPDRKDGCYVLVHIGETNTTIAVLVKQKLMFTREIAIGAEDFHKAIMQRIVDREKAIQIDHDLAETFLREYGILQGVSGIIPGTQIDLYKISIFLRPVVERLSSELNRSLNYFKKQSPELEWDEMLFDGAGATFPNLVKILHKNLNVNVGLLNPVRIDKYSYKKGAVIPDQELPNYSINFALALESCEKINIIPNKIRNNYRFIFPSKLAIIVTIFLIPLFVTTTNMSYQKTFELREKVKRNNQQWENLSKDAKEYFTMMDDLNILDGYKRFLSNDRTYSINQIKLLKVLSSRISDEIKLTALEFKKEVLSKDEKGQNHEQINANLLEVSGFVQAHASVSDIYFTNLLMSLENLPFFTKVESTLEEHSKPDEGRLLFTLKMRF